MMWQALSARPNLVCVLARVVTQKPGRDGGVKGHLEGGGGNIRRRASANAYASNSHQHIGGGCFVKRGGEYGERLDRGADVSRRSLQSDHQRVFAVVSGRSLLVGFGRYCWPRHGMTFKSSHEHLE